MEELEHCCFVSLPHFFQLFFLSSLSQLTETAAAEVFEQEVTQQGKQNNQSEGLEKFGSEAFSPR